MVVICSLVAAERVVFWALGRDYFCARVVQRWWLPLGSRFAWLARLFYPTVV
jgi:hypothetical protein